MALNKVMLIGNVGNDPEIRYLDSNPQSPQGNAKVASFRLATTERYRDRNGETRENTEWHSIVAWRSNADLVEKYVHKGSQIYVEGKLRTRQWTDQTGNKRYTTEINADNIQLLGKRPDAAQPGQGYQGQGNADGYQGQTAPAYGAQQGYQGASAYSAPQGGYQANPAPSAPGYVTQQGGYAGPGYASQPAQSPASQPAYAPQAAQPAYQAPVPPAQPASDAPDDDLPF